MHLSLRLFLLNKPVTDIPVSISLNDNPSFPPDGTPVVAIGMGLQNQGASFDQVVTGPLSLHDVVIPIVNTQKCKSRYGSSRFKTDVMMCAGKAWCP